VNRAEFEKLVAKALADLPPEFRQKMDNVDGSSRIGLRRET